MDDWKHAACIGLESLFDSDRLVREQIEVCHTCPVRNPCGERAITEGEPLGVWGGLTPAHRDKVRRRRGLPPRSELTAAEADREFFAEYAQEAGHEKAAEAIGILPATLRDRDRRKARKSRQVA